jgi:hypothetical protein
MRIKWIQRLQEIVAEMPQADRPQNALVLAAATVDGAEGGTLVSDATPEGGRRTKGYGAGAALVGAGALGLLWFLLA